MYSEIDKPEIAKGIKFWRNPKNRFPVLMLHYSADPDKDPDTVKGAEWYDKERAGTSKAQWDKEYEISFTSKSGKLIYGPEFCSYDPSLDYQNPHWVEPFEWGEPCELIMSLDFGQRNPTGALIGVWTMQKELYIVDEYYGAGLPSFTSKEMFKKFAYIIAPGQEKEFLAMPVNKKRDIINSRFSIKVIDPTTKNKNRTGKKDGQEIPYSVLEEFYDNGWEFELGNNDVNAGFTRVREYMKVEVETGKPHLFYFKGKLTHFRDEKHNYRYKTLSEQQARVHNEPEEPIKKNDHLMDAERYLLMTRPVTPDMVGVPKTRIQKDIENLLRPKIITNDWDVD